MTSPTGGFEVATGFLRIVADYKSAEKDVDKFTRDVNGRLHDQHGRFVKEGRESGKGWVGGFGGGILGGLKSFASIGKGIAGAIIGSLKPLLYVGIAQAISELAPVLVASLGALALVPAAIGAAGLGVATLAIGMHGLGDAFGAMGQEASGASVNVAAAERRIAQAQRESLAAQRALLQSRKDAKENLEDLGRALSGARLDEEAAIFAVADAKKELDKQERRGNPEAIERASLAYRQAQQSLDEIRDRVGDLADEKTEADRKGVEGSDAVQAALQRQIDSTQELADARAALTAGGGVDKFADALSKLAPSAAAFVLAIKGLGPAFGALRMDVQQRLFAGLADTAQNLGMAILPALKSSLGIVADGFNGVFKRIGGMVTAAAGMTVFGDTMNSLGQAIVNVSGILPGLISGFLTLTEVGSKYLGGLTSGFTGLGDRFAGWMKQLQSSGQLDQFIQGGIAALTVLGGLLKDLGSIVMSVFSAMGTAGGQALGPIGTLVHQLAAFFKSAEGGNALTAIFSTLGAIAGVLGPLISGLLPPLAQLITGLATGLQPLIATLGGSLVPTIVTLATTLVNALMPVIAALSPALDKVLKALMPIVEVIGNGLGQVLQAVSPLLADVATILGDVLGVAISALKPLFDAIIPPIVEFVGVLAEALRPILKSVGELFAALMPAISPLLGLIGTLLAVALIPLQLILKPLGWLIGKLVDAITWLITPIALVIGWVADWVNNMIKAHMNIDAITKTIVAVFSWLGDRIGAAFGWIKDRISQSIEGWKLIFARVGQIVGGVIGFFSRLRRGIIDRISASIEFVKSVPGKILAALGNLSKLLYNAGKNVVMGLWDGIKSTAGNIGRWFLDLLPSWIVVPFKAALGIASPSKVMADLVGRHIPTGIVAGAESAAAAARNSLAKMARNLVPTGEMQLAFAGGGGGGGPAFGQGAAATTAAGPVVVNIASVVVEVDLGDGVRKVVDGRVIRVIQENPTKVAATVDEGRRQRNAVQPGRTRR